MKRASRKSRSDWYLNYKKDLTKTYLPTAVFLQVISGAHVAYGLTTFPTNGPFPRLLTTTTTTEDVLLTVHYDLPFTYYFSRDVDGEGESLSDFYFCCAKTTRDNDKCDGRNYYWPRHVIKCASLDSTCSIAVEVAGMAQLIYSLTVPIDCVLLVHFLVDIV